MLGETERQSTLTLGLTPEGVVPRDHPLRRFKPLVDSARVLLKEVVNEARPRRLFSADQFTFDGTLLEAWASHKSYRPHDEQPPKSGGRNRDADLQGERHSRDSTLLFLLSGGAAELAPLVEVA